MSALGRANEGKKIRSMIEGPDAPSAWSEGKPHTAAEFCADQVSQPAHHRPHAVSLEPGETLRMAEKHWYRKAGVRNFDAVGFAQEICKEYGISVYKRADGN